MNSSPSNITNDTNQPSPSYCQTSLSPTETPSISREQSIMQSKDFPSSSNFLPSQLHQNISLLPEQLLAFRKVLDARANFPLLNCIYKRQFEHLNHKGRAGYEKDEQEEFIRKQMKCNEDANNVSFVNIFPKTEMMKKLSEQMSRNKSDAFEQEKDMEKVKKNRMSAQQSRDKHKAFVRGLNQENKTLKDEKTLLLQKNKELQDIITKLSRENEALKHERPGTCLNCDISFGVELLSPNLNNNCDDFDDLYRRN